MYVGLPRNYGGTAFNEAKRRQREAQTASLPPQKPTAEPPACKDCPAEGKNPFSCLINALKHSKSGGISGEDLMLIGLIALLIGKSGSEDIVLILAMLFLM